MKYRCYRTFRTKTVDGAKLKIKRGEYITAEAVEGGYRIYNGNAIITGAISEAFVRHFESTKA